MLGALALSLGIGASVGRAGTPIGEGGLLTSSPVTPPVERILDGDAAVFARPVLDQNAESAGGGGMSPRVKSMLLSLLVPGLGQYVAGDRSWSYGFFAAEAAIWGSYIAFQVQGNAREDRFQDFAHVWAGVENASGHSSTYYSDLGTFPTYEDYRVVAIRSGEGELYPEDQHWAWPSDERRVRYLDLRAASEDSFQRAEFMLAAALVNRAVSVVHAARSVSDSRSAVTLRVLPDTEGALMPTVAWQTRF
jgi:hypothetical protein